MSRILLVTIELAGRSGTEIVTFETAHGLQRRGHEVAIYTLRLGSLGNAVSEKFPVFRHIELLTWRPDLIQANHTYPLINATARFPDVPVFSICHDATAWFNEPLHLPTIRKQAAVSLACRDRIVQKIPKLAGRVELLHNAVDLESFHARASLPSRPKRALILSNHVIHAPGVRSACTEAGLDVDLLGPGVGRVVDDLPSRLLGYDLVFATGRMALEAMAVGCAVIVVDGRGLAGMVTSDAVSSWRDHNFGLWLLKRPIVMADIAVEIDRYDAVDAGRVSEFIRRHSSLSGYIDRLEAIYQSLITDSAADPLNSTALTAALGKSFRSLLSAMERQIEAQRNPRDGSSKM